MPFPTIKSKEYFQYLHMLYTLQGMAADFLSSHIRIEGLRHVGRVPFQNLMDTGMKGGHLSDRFFSVLRIRIVHPGS